MAYTIKRRNTPVATLIKNYFDKKGGKVSESRREIQTRFDYLDWKDQKKIVLAFLESGKTDRRWAYSKVLDFWDKSFETKIRELWERLHEDVCSWVVIRHFPINYLIQHIDSFTEDRDYYFICLRLAEDKDYLIDKEKLSLTDYLAVLYHTGRNISIEEADDIPYQIVYDICVKGFKDYNELDRYTDTSKDSLISPINFSAVSLALYYLKKLGCNQVVWKFETWNTVVQENISHSPELTALSGIELRDWDYKAGKILIARKYAYLALDRKYKLPSDPDIESIMEPKEWFVERSEDIRKQKNPNPVNTEPVDPKVLQEMIDNNPALKKLVGDFGLDVNTDDALPF